MYCKNNNYYLHDTVVDVVWTGVGEETELRCVDFLGVWSVNWCNWS